MSKSKKLRTVDEAAAILGISRATLYRWLESGRLKGERALVRMVRLGFTDQQLAAARRGSETRRAS